MFEPLSVSDLWDAVEASPARALFLDMVDCGASGSDEEADGMLGTAADYCGSQMHTLGLKLAGDNTRSVVTTLGKLVSNRQLPALRTLLLYTSPGDLASKQGLAALRPCIKQMLRAGVCVRLLDVSSIAERELGVLQELSWAAPDPDLLLLGVREDVHGVSS